MKAKRQEKEAKPQRWIWGVAAAAVLMAAFWAYGPVLQGPFVFDDKVWEPAANSTPGHLLHGVRPVLMFSYWANAQLSGDNPYSYHVINVLFHCLAAGLVFFVIRRLLEFAAVSAPKRDPLAVFAALVFLLHPVQTEAVAYLAGRSESLSTFFELAAFTVFLYRRQATITWANAIAILGLFAAALLTKEQTIVLPALLLLTDFWWNPGFSVKGIVANWRLYLPMAAGALGGVAFLWTLITRSTSAGFALKDFTWYQYFFTQCRALFVYIREFFVPVNLTADWDFPISHTLTDRGAAIGLVVLIALLAAAWIFRRRFPLAAYGFFVYLVLMLPTSSILPIQDPLAERRLYFSILGLVLVVLELLRRVNLPVRQLAAACATLVLVLAAITHARAAVWSDPVALWEDTVSKSPAKSRPHFQLGSAYADAGRCDAAIQEYAKAAQYKTPDYNLLIDWALAYDCNRQPDQALAKLREAAALEQTAHVYSQIGMVYAKQARWLEALDALTTAEKLDPSFAMTYAYRGGILLATGRPAEAIKEYQHALALDPANAQALDGMPKALAAQRAGR